MQHDIEVEILKTLMHQLDTDTNVDAGEQVRMSPSVYACPEVAAREWQTFFRDHPQLIGFSRDLPEPGSFMTVDDFGTPVLATRGKDGRFRAFLNVCRHRGARIANEARGTANRFFCTYHAWGYANTGELLSVPQEDAFGEVDKACHGLIALPAQERDGMLWVHPKPDGVLDLDAVLGGLAQEIAAQGLGEYVYADTKTIDMRLNWKLANDTFGETYHFAKLHKDTLGRIAYGDALAYEEFGRNHRFVFARRSIDGLRTRPEVDWRLVEGATLLYYLFPNIQIVFGVGRVSLVRLYPMPGDPGRSITRITQYFTQAMLDRVKAAERDPGVRKITADMVYTTMFQPGDAMTLEALAEVFTSTIEHEDYVMGEQQQRSAESGLIERVTFGRNEAALHHFHRCFRDALGMEPLERVGAV